VLDALAPGTHRLVVEVARMADGAPIGIPVNVLVGDALGPRLVAVAGIHGDEHDGPAALLELSDVLHPTGVAGTLVMVPVANPPAFRTTSRWNRQDGVNLNRVFPGEPDGPITHRLGRTLVDTILTGADFVVTIHGWTAGWLTVPYVEYTIGHETSVASRAGAAAFGLDYLEPLGLLPGRLASHVASVGIPMCEVEIGGEGITLPERRAIGERGVIGLMRHLGMLDGPVASPPEQHDVARHQVVAPVGGAFRRRDDMSVGTVLAAGEVLGTICDLNGRPLESIEAPTGGVLAILRHALSIEPGDLVAAIFGPVDRDARSLLGLV
jgi:predicted deacylase